MSSRPDRSHFSVVATKRWRSCRADPVPEHERLFRIFEDDAVPMNVENTVNKAQAQQELAHLTGQLRYLRSLARSTTPTTARSDGTSDVQLGPTVLRVRRRHRPRGHSLSPARRECDRNVFPADFQRLLEPLSSKQRHLPPPPPWTSQMA